MRMFSPVRIPGPTCSGSVAVIFLTAREIYAVSGGTTELMIEPVIPAAETPLISRISRSSMAYWSSIRERSVAMREMNSSSLPR